MTEYTQYKQNGDKLEQNKEKQSKLNRITWKVTEKNEMSVAVFVQHRHQKVAIIYSKGLQVLRQTIMFMTKLPNRKLYWAYVLHEWVLTRSLFATTVVMIRDELYLYWWQCRHFFYVTRNTGSPTVDSRVDGTISALQTLTTISVVITYL